MAANPSQWFSCPSCGQRFPWKPAYAGRKLSCKCGHAFVPASPIQASEDAGEYDVANDTAAPPLAPVAPVRAAPVLSYRSAPPETLPENRAARTRSWQSADLIVPTALLAVGGLFRAVMYWMNPAGGEGGLLALVLLGTLGVIALILSMLLGVFISAKLLGIQFGRPVPTLLKLISITITAAIAFPLVAMMDRSHGTTGYTMAWSVVLILYWLMFSGLFDLELQDVMMTVAIVGGLQASVSCILFRAWW